jgi:hypothetical protein
MMKQLNRRSAAVRLTLTGILTVLFAVCAWVVFDAALFTAWEPGIPGCEEYYSWNGYSYALWSIFVELGWVTIPLLALICFGWFTGLSTLKQKRESANQHIHGTAYRRP